MLGEIRGEVRFKEPLSFHTSLRIGFGRFTTEQEVDTAVEDIVKHVSRLRQMSPLWEMVQEGIDLKSIQWAAH